MIARRLLVAALVLSAMAACDDGDDTAPTSTDPPTTEATATSDPTATTDAPTTAPTTAPSTSTAPGPTTSPEDALAAEIAADYLEAEEAIYALVHEPSLDQLEQRVALVAAPGSPFFDLMVARVTELVELGDIVTANDPDIDHVEIEDIEVVDGDSALLTICRVTNLKQVTPGASPTGEDVLTLGTGELIASRSRECRLCTSNAWLRDNLKRRPRRLAGA